MYCVTARLITPRNVYVFRSVYLAGTGLQTLTAIVPALVGCPEHSTLGDAKSSSLALGVG